MPGGGIVTREVVEHFGAVAIVAMDDNGNIPMVYQYRHTYGRRLWELPAGLLDVAVFPPIPVDDWTLDALPDRIAEVRQLYLDTLADWPVDGLPAVDLYAEQKAARKARAQVAKATAKRVPAKKAPAKSAANKGAAATKAATKKASPKAKPSESKIAGKDGEASASPSSSAKGRS